MALAAGEAQVVDREIELGVVGASGVRSIASISSEAAVSCAAVGGTRGGGPNRSGASHL